MTLDGFHTEQSQLSLSYYHKFDYIGFAYTEYNGWKGEYRVWTCIGI